MHRQVAAPLLNENRKTQVSAGNCHQIVSGFTALLLTMTDGPKDIIASLLRQELEL